MRFGAAGLALTVAVLAGLASAPAWAAAAEPGPGRMLEQALLLESLGRHEAARGLYARAACTVAEPDLRRFAVLQSARCSLAMGRQEDAMQILDQALAADPEPRFRETACREAGLGAARRAALPPRLARACSALSQTHGSGLPAPANAVPPGADHSPEVRVLLVKQAAVSLACPVGMRLRAGGRERVLPSGETEFLLRGGTVVCRVHPSGGRPASLDCGSEAWVEPAGGYLRLGGRHYGGRLRMLPRGGSLAVVQHLPLETYLRGVVPGEMPAHWPQEALKAQAVAARTFALANLQGPDHPFDLYADQRSQVYLGQAPASPATDRAVAATRGLVLTHRGLPFPAYYHAHSGGWIEGAGPGQPGPAEVLAPGPEPARDAMPPMVWQVELGQGKLLSLLARSGHPAGRVLDLLVDEKSPGGRARSFSIISDAGLVKLPASRFRELLGNEGLRSLLCSVRPHADGFLVSGRGYGHGVGMSQFGAASLAQSGMGFAQILARYYHGAAIGKAP